MSGTSLDGVDAALCRVSGSGRATRIEQLAFRCTSYEPALRQEIEQTLRGSVADVCALNVRLGEVFAEAALAVIEEAGLAPADVDAIASHGQTVYHVDQSRGTPATLQIGEASVIAERTGAIVVSDFRPRDIAAGGGGAPLVAYLDDCLFAREGEVRLLQNLGGIANVTAVTHDPSRSIAFDTGPGNLPIDAVTRVLTSGRARYDEDGNYSRLGEVDQALLDHLCEHPFLAAPPPKTTGREEFGDAFSQALIESYDPARLIDLLATLVRFTARSIARAYREHLVPRTGPIHEVIVSGGGVHNLTLMAAIRDELDGLAPVSSFDDLDVGFSADAKEAVAFCVLGNETLQGLPSNLPAATGARRAVVLGKIVL
ncbi:MAG: anhydro-N-acetylmuramic acid kinase [Planctomycetes bacterium]|nr:anhydro-N-acetylmuramic acid kinase [Planctomycetota bacterium]